jgi:predicted glycosyltransferase
MPHGAMGELLPTLEMLRDEPTAVVLGLRDILDAPSVVRERWRLEGAYEAVERYYDRVLVYGSSDVFDVAAEYGWPEAARSKVRYCGYVCASSPIGVSGRVRSQYLGSARDTDLIVAMAGGGADAYPLFDALLDAVPLIEQIRRCRVVLVTGPFLPADRYDELADRARGLPVTVLASVPDAVTYAASADLVVAMAGYNTTAEILSVGTPALLVPRSGPSAEQQMRARLFAERGWVDWLHPEDLGAERLGKAVATILDRPWGETAASPPDLRGRMTGTSWLIEALHRTDVEPPAPEGRTEVVPDDYKLA